MNYRCPFDGLATLSLRDFWVWGQLSASIRTHGPAWMHSAAPYGASRPGPYLRKTGLAACLAGRADLGRDTPSTGGRTGDSFKGSLHGNFQFGGPVFEQEPERE